MDRILDRRKQLQIKVYQERHDRHETKGVAKDKAQEKEVRHERDGGIEWKRQSEAMGEVEERERK